MMQRSSALAAVAAVVLASCAADEDGGGSPAGTNGGQAASCLPTQRNCGLGCVDVTVNALHCGACGVACPLGTACQAGVCGAPCAAGLGSCGGQCVSLQTATNCGTCGNACPAGQLCVAGACSATCNGTVCTGPSGPECVSLTDNANHCGACGNVCPAGNVCVGVQCVLDCGALTACNGACVDVLTDGANCGTCGTACTGGKSCVQGACACPVGLEACGEACIDTTADPEHCGGCDQACVASGMCEGGQCTGGPDGCTDTPVSGLALHAVDVYQSVQIPIMEQAGAIPSAERNADVVAGRKALFRIHVTPEAGWMPREVSARVELTHVEAPTPDQKELFFAPLSPTTASTDDDPSSTFQVMVPAEAIAPDTRYSITLVECAGAPTAPTATSMGARFPATGYQPLEARESGPLKVHVIPVGSPGPDVSDEGLRAFKERLEAVYPITEVMFTIGEPMQASASSMCSLLASITSRRSQDGAAVDVYYYGLTPGILGGESGCSNANVSASSAKVSVGWAQGYGGPDQGKTGAGTMCHEIGHAHGRQHAPCNVQDPDRNYPYPDADIGVWAYDFRSDEFYEPTRKDMMSYCPEPRWAAWISDYNYQAILERVVAVSALAEVPALDGEAMAEVPWRLFVSDAAGMHWIDEPLLVRGTPEGTPLPAVVHGEHGPMQQVAVYKQDLDDGLTDDAFMLTLPEPDGSWHAIEVPGLLAPRSFPAAPRAR